VDGQEALQVVIAKRLSSEATFQHRPLKSAYSQDI
jgi:hypothetical protein